MKIFDVSVILQKSNLVIQNSKVHGKVQMQKTLEASIPKYKSLDPKLVFYMYMILSLIDGVIQFCTCCVVLGFYQTFKSRFSGDTVGRSAA